MKARLSDSSTPRPPRLEDGVYCPGVGPVACVAAGENGSGAEIEWMSSATGQWSAASIPRRTR